MRATRVAPMIATAYLLLSVIAPVGATDFGPSAADYESIQSALDANSGQLVFLPPGNYEINEKIRIRTDDSGLWGTGADHSNEPGPAYP